jgi:hypothetical protein
MLRRLPLLNFSHLVVAEKKQVSPRRRAGGSVRMEGVLMEAVESRVLLSTFTVTNTSDSGSGSLRQAILNANKTTTADTINFKIGTGAKTIYTKSRLPGIEQPTNLDATTQPGFSGKPIIELNGSQAGSVDGLKLVGTGITVKGLVINHFGGSGIFIYNKGGNKIVGNFIGTDKYGTGDAGNGAHGIIVQSQNNTIGGLTSSERNIISGNGKAGIFFYLAAASHNKVIGNYIGTDVTGTKKIANNCGVQINGAAYVAVGGTTSGSRNVISGNVHDGVLMVTTGTKYNTVQGNYIGTNAAGTGRLGNGWYGVEISQHDNSVGGTTSAARNIISANGMDGVAFYLTTGINNKVEGNYIGTDVTGTKDLGNTGAGVCATNGASHNMIGGTSSASRNVIAGNDLFGVGIYNGSSYITVQNNYIGVGATGYTLLNAKYGVVINNGSNNCKVTGNKIASQGTYRPIVISSGSASQVGSNSLYANTVAGLKVI